MVHQYRELATDLVPYLFLPIFLTVAISRSVRKAVRRDARIRKMYGWRK